MGKEAALQTGKYLALFISIEGRAGRGNRVLTETQKWYISFLMLPGRALLIPERVTLGK